MEDLSKTLHRIRTSAGLSLRQMAAKTTVPYSHAALGYYETGRSPVPDGLVQTYENVVAEELGMPDVRGADPVDTLATLGRFDVDRRSLFRTAAYSAATALLPLQLQHEQPQRLASAENGMQVGINEVSAVRDVVDFFTARDEKVGGSDGRPAVAAYCASDVAGYLRGRFANDEVRRQMFGAGAEAAYLAGWKAHDVGKEAEAERYYLGAYQLAREAGLKAHAAYVMRILCHQAFHLGQGGQFLPQAEAAVGLVSGRVEPHTEALFTITVARAHAAQGNRRAALDAIARAERQISRPAGQMPRWAALWGSPDAQVHNHAGASLRELGDLAGAEEKARHAAALWNPDTHPRIRAITLSRVARAQYDQGRHGDAIVTWQQLLPQLDGINSSRIAKLRATAAKHITNADR